MISQDYFLSFVFQGINANVCIWETMKSFFDCLKNCQTDFHFLKWLMQESKMKKIVATIQTDISK